MGWFFITILLPLVAPLLALLAFKLFPQVSPMPLIAPFKDGQLCWAALGFCASALYEIFSSLGKRWLITAAGNGWLVATLIVTLVFSAIIAAEGAVFPNLISPPPGMGAVRHLSCFLASLALTLLAAVLYAVVHYI